jgi:hypothetical protein
MKTNSSTIPLNRPALTSFDCMPQRRVGAHSGRRTSIDRMLALFRLRQRGRGRGDSFANSTSASFPRSI